MTATSEADVDHEANAGDRATLPREAVVMMKVGSNAVHEAGVYRLQWPRF